MRPFIVNLSYEWVKGGPKEEERGDFCCLQNGQILSWACITFYNFFKMPIRKTYKHLNHGRQYDVAEVQ